MPTPQAMATAVPDLALGVAFLLAWTRPELFHGHVVGKLTLVMLLEFHHSLFGILGTR